MALNQASSHLLAFGCASDEASKGLGAKVAAELARAENRNLVAFVSEAMDTVTTYIVPQPYWATQVSEREAVGLDPLRAEATRLRTVIDRPTTPFTERERARARLREIERLLDDERLTRQPWTRPEIARQSRPDWAGLTEAARGLVTMIAAANMRGEDLGQDFARLPRALGDDEEVAASWRSSREWRAWIGAPAEVRRAFVRSTIEDLSRGMA